MCSKCAGLPEELRHAVKLVQKEAASVQSQLKDENQLRVADSECSRELIALIEACLIHGMNKKFKKVSLKNGKEMHQINIWPVLESVTSSADQKRLKAENTLLNRIQNC